MTNIPYTEIIGILAGNQKDVKDKNQNIQQLKLIRKQKFYSMN